MPNKNMQNQAKAGKKTFIERALEQILTDKDISRSHHLQLKKACESALGECRTLLANNRHLCDITHADLLLALRFLW